MDPQSFGKLQENSFLHFSALSFLPLCRYPDDLWWYHRPAKRGFRIESHLRVQQTKTCIFWHCSVTFFSNPPSEKLFPISYPTFDYFAAVSSWTPNADVMTCKHSDAKHVNVPVLHRGPAWTVDVHWSASPSRGGLPPHLWWYIPNPDTIRQTHRDH